MASRPQLCFVTKTVNYLAPVLVWTKRVDLIFGPTYLSSKYIFLDGDVYANVFLYRVLVKTQLIFRGVNISTDLLLFRRG
jgi:hypothetical protein